MAFSSSTPTLFTSEKPTMTPLAVRRTLADLEKVRKEKSLPGIYCHVPDEGKIHQIHMLVVGPPGSPYEGGFYFFECVQPNNYPFEPPKVSFRTTDGNRVRFNPNLYACGKVCLSLLGTWSGPPWSAVQSLLSLFTSIQALILCNSPVQNEPGHESARGPEVTNYNDCVLHENLRVAVCDVMEESLHGASSASSSAVSAAAAARVLSAPFVEQLDQKFLENFDRYIALAMDGKERLEGKQFASGMFNSTNSRTFAFQRSLDRLYALKPKVEARIASRGGASGASSSSSCASPDSSISSISAPSSTPSIAAAPPPVAIQKDSGKKRSISSSSVPASPSPPIPASPSSKKSAPSPKK